LKNNISL